MTNTQTSDVQATLGQIEQLVNAGADIVRVSTPTQNCVGAFAELKKKAAVPLVADVHYDYKIALGVIEAGCDCLRINPGNIGGKDKIRQVVQAAKDSDIPIRVGVNAGSLEKDLQVKYTEPTAAALVESALRHIEWLEAFGYQKYKVSLKASNVSMCVEAYQLIASQVDCPIHVGITEAGSWRNGTVKSSVGIGALLMQGIGDTIRCSLAADPVLEIKVGWDILRSLGLRSRGVNIIACPSCSRQNFPVIEVVNALEERLEDISEPIDVSVIGCLVNGPGEAKHTAIGLTGASKGHMLYDHGKAAGKVSTKDIVDSIEQRVRTQLKLVATSA